MPVVIGVIDPLTMALLQFLLTWFVTTAGG